MSLNLAAIRAYPFQTVTRTLSDVDCVLYALSIGLARDPLDEDELHYVLEDSLTIFPTMPVVLGDLGAWMMSLELGITFESIVHATQRLHIHRPMTPGMTFVATHRVREIV